MKLPFGQIPPGTFDAAFPKSPTTGLPAMHQGVETQARRMQAPPPMINTVASDTVAKLGMNGPAPMTAAPPPASMMMSANPQRPAPPSGMGGPFPPSMMAAPMTPVNALSRGAPAGMGSMLGGPRPAGGRSANDPMRIAETARRQGDPRLIMGLAQQQQGQQFQREMFGAQQNAMNQRDAVNFDQGLQMFGAQQNAMNQRDAMNFQQKQHMFQLETARRAGESALEWQRRRDLEAERRAAQSIVGGEQMKLDNGFVPMVKRSDGTMSMAGGFMPAKETAPPMTADDIAAARAMGGDVRMQMGDTQVSFPGQGPAAKSAKPNISWQTSEDGMSKVPYESVTDPKTGQTVLRRVKIVDENGDGIDDRAASGWQSWAEQ